MELDASWPSKWISSGSASATSPRAQDATNAPFSAQSEVRRHRRLERLRLAMNVQSASGDPDLMRANKDVKRQIDTVSKEVARLVGLLESGGFVDVSSEDDDSE